MHYQIIGNDFKQLMCFTIQLIEDFIICQTKHIPN